MNCTRLGNAFIGLLLVLVCMIGSSCSCPTSCVCKWKNGKQTVECVDKGLLIIPQGMDSGTQVLEFSGNNLRTLHKAQFHRMDLINLQRIYLARCQILIIENGTFKGLTNLVELDLSGNALEHVPSPVFLDCPSLMRLILNGNPIRSIRRDAFAHLSFLHTLELSACQITQIDFGAFNGLHSLERLRLGQNALAVIDGAGSMPTRLQEIELQGNDWQCDCGMMEMRDWLESYELPSNAAPVCARPPRLAKRPVKSIARPELACVPDVAPATFYLEIAEGKNVSLQCQIRAMPEAHVSWTFQGQLVQNDTLLTPETRLIYYVDDAGGAQTTSELFIYNTQQDDNGTFVCSAENAAGVGHANFTIRILLQTEPRSTDLAQLPLEFILIVASATGVSMLVICFALILSLVKCHSEQRRRRTLKDGHRNLVFSNSTKDSLLQESSEEFSEIAKDASESNIATLRQQIVLPTSMSPMLAANQLRVSSLQLEQNPDLINDAESMSIGKRHDGDGAVKMVDAASEFSEGTCGAPPTSDVSILHHQPMHPGTCYLPPPAPGGFPLAEQHHRQSADVHLNPAGLLNAANICGAANFANGNCYRTLPYNRTVKRQASLQETHTFHRDVEFASSHPPRQHSYEHYQTNLRYTADGYPVRGGCCDSEQETLFSDSESLRSCCSAPAVPWPHSNVPLLPIAKSAGEEVKTVVAAQTQTDITTINGNNQNANLNGSAKPSNRSVSSALKIAETLTESPDEGYEGEEGQTKV